MARKTVIIAICDGCGTEEGVSEHTASVDGRAEVIVDACDSCWRSAYGPFETLLGSGQSAKVARRQRRAATVAPGATTTGRIKSDGTPAKKPGPKPGIRRTGKKTATKTAQKKTQKAAQKKTARKVAKKQATRKAPRSASPAEEAAAAGG